MRHGERLNRPAADSAALCLLLLVALVFGGGGSPATVAELVVQIATLAIVGALVFMTGSTAHLPHAAVRRDWLIGGLGIALIALYLLQLIPLPPSLWSMLPGRDALAINLEAFDDKPWLPLSIAPHLTFASLLSLIPPFAAYALASNTGRDAGVWVLRTLAFFAALTIGLQLLQKTGDFNFHDQMKSSFTHGFQANRNSQGDILAIMMSVLAIRSSQGWSRLAFAAQQLSLAAVLLVAVILTGSRSGVAITGAVALLVGYSTLRESGIVTARGRSIAIAIAVIVMAGAIWYAFSNPVVLSAFDRFGSGSRGRTEIVWPDAVYALKQFLPLGAGFGTFIPAFQIFESQETFTALRANRAHSEPLEVLIEAGIPGAIVIAGLIVAALGRGWSGARRSQSEEERSRGLLLVIVTMLLLTHSLIDYPMRSMSIAVLFATLLGLIVADRRRRLDKDRKTVDAEADQPS